MKKPAEIKTLGLYRSGKLIRTTTVVGARQERRARAQWLRSWSDATTRVLKEKA